MGPQYLLIPFHGNYVYCIGQGHKVEGIHKIKSLGFRVLKFGLAFWEHPPSMGLTLLKHEVNVIITIDRSQVVTFLSCH